MLVQLLKDQGSQWTAAGRSRSGQQLQVAVGLAGSGGGTAVEEPETAGVAVHLSHCPPVVSPQPAGLGLPVLADQQQMAGLHRVFVEQHHMGVSQPGHLQAGIPGQEGVGPGTAGPQVLGGGTQQATHLKGFGPRQAEELGGQGHQGLLSTGLLGTLQSCLPEAFSPPHRPSDGPGMPPGSNGRGSGCRRNPAGQAPGPRAGSCWPPGGHGPQS